MFDFPVTFFKTKNTAKRSELTVQMYIAICYKYLVCNSPLTSKILRENLSLFSVRLSPDEYLVSVIHHCFPLTFTKISPLKLRKQIKTNLSEYKLIHLSY